MRSRPSTLVSAAWQGALAGGLAFVGLLLPVDFFTRLNSLLMSFRPLEIVSVYGAAWITYAILGLLAGGVIAFVGAGLLILVRKYNPIVPRFLASLVIALVLARALQQAVSEFIGEAAGSTNVPGFSLVTRLLMVGFAVWLAWRQSSILIRLRSFLNFVAVCGLSAVGVALVMAAVPEGRRQDTRPSSTQGQRPPIILITIDTLAASHMSLYGYSRETTPALSRMASQSVVFEGHHSNSNFTTSGIGSLLSGARPWRHRAFQLGARPLPGIARHGLLASVHGAQYRTLAVTSNMFAASDLHRSRRWVDRQASGRVDEAIQQFMQRVPFGESLRSFPTPKRFLNGYQSYLERSKTGNLHFDPESAFSEARQMLDSRAGVEVPVFLWVHLFPPHDPYAAPAPFLRTFEPKSQALTQSASRRQELFRAGRSRNFPGVLLGRYDEAIRYVDYHVGQFLDWLKQQGRFDDALIVVTSDHGESFTHGYGGHTGPMLHEELIRVPLLVKLPHQQQGRRVSGLVTEHADILPTILEYLGEPASGYVEGRSLKPVLEGGTIAPTPMYAMNFEQNGAFAPLKTGSVAMLDGRYKYVRYLGDIKYEFMPKLEDGLYDLSTDPEEFKNLASEMPDRAAQMRAAIDAQVAAHSLPLTLKD